MIIYRTEGWEVGARQPVMTNSPGPLVNLVNLQVQTRLRRCFEEEVFGELDLAGGVELAAVTEAARSRACY